MRCSSASRARGRRKAGGQAEARCSVEAANIDERDNADRFGDLDASLQAQLQAGFATDRVVVGVERSGFLICVCTDRAAAAGIDALVGGKLSKRSALDRGNRREASDDIAITVGEPLIGTRRDSSGRESQGGTRKAPV